MIQKQDQNGTVMSVMVTSWSRDDNENDSQIAAKNLQKKTDTQ